MAAAVDLYNKPAFPYRNEAFTILAINGWELLLKSRWLVLNQHRKRSLYVYYRPKTSEGTPSQNRKIRRSRSSSPITHSVDFLAKQLVNKRLLNHLVLKNIEVMLEFRDCATHFYNVSPNFNTRLFEIGAACVNNFVNLVHDWFSRDITELGQNLMPISFVALPRSARATLLNPEETGFLSFLNNIDADEDDPESPYSILVSVELNFFKSSSPHVEKVRVTNDPAALPVQLTEESIRKRFPWDYKTLTDRCRTRYKEFKVDSRYHTTRKELEKDIRYAHPRFLDPGNSKSSKKIFYSPDIVAALDANYDRL